MSKVNTYPLISILIPVYNVEDDIERCCRSIFRQDYDNLEIIFVNDDTPDNSISVLNNILSQYPNRQKQVRILHHKTNKGLAQSRNTLLDNAKGEYVFIVDSDDFILCDSAISQFTKIALEDNADIVEANYNKLFKDHYLTVELKRYYKDKRQLLKDIIHKRSSITIWNKLIKRSVFEINGIRVPININNGEDYVTLPKIMYYANKISKLNYSTYGYNQCNINSYSNNKRKWKNLDMMIYANLNLRDFFTEHDSSLLPDIDIMLSETRIFHLLYCNSLQELETTRLKFKKYNVKYHLNMRWKFQIIYFLDFLQFNSFILSIGKVFRSR